MSLSEWVLLGLTAAAAFVVMLLKQCRVLYFFVLCSFSSGLSLPLASFELSFGFVSIICFGKKTVCIKEKIVNH